MYSEQLLPGKPQIEVGISGGSTPTSLGVGVHDDQPGLPSIRGRNNHGA